jgi:hypothetical protein
MVELLRTRVFGVLAGVGVVAVVSCGGVQVEEPESAGSAGQPESGSGVGGGIAPNGGTSSSSTGGRSGSVGGRAGSASPVGGKGGQAAGQAGRGGGGVGGRADLGQAGEVEPGGAGGEGGEIPTCNGRASYEGPRSGINCRSFWELQQDDVFVKVEGATNLEECKAACDARPDCTAVSDFFERRADYGCYVTSAECDPIEPVWAEEDAGLEYVKVCPASGDCYLDFLGWGVRCSDDGAYMKVAGATSVAECALTCLQDASCVSTLDHSYLNEFVGCFLNIAPCDELVQTYDAGDLYRKTCR